MTLHRTIWQRIYTNLFNPSRVTAVSAHQLLVNDDWNYAGLSPPLSADELQAISAKAQQEDDE